MVIARNILTISKFNKIKGVGYIRDGNEQTVIITKSEHIIKLLFENECNMEICGLNKVCLAYFETSAASLLKGL